MTCKEEAQSAAATSGSSATISGLESSSFGTKITRKITSFQPPSNEPQITRKITSFQPPSSNQSDSSTFKVPPKVTSSILIIHGLTDDIRNQTWLEEKLGSYGHMQKITLGML